MIWFKQEKFFFFAPSQCIVEIHCARYNQYNQCTISTRTNETIWLATFGKSDSKWSGIHTVMSSEFIPDP